MGSLAGRVVVATEAARVAATAVAMEAATVEVVTVIVVATATGAVGGER